MIFTDYRQNAERVKRSYEFVREAYPDQVEKAREMIIEYLSRYDRQRLLVFTGEVADRDYDAPVLEDAHLLISSMLYQKDTGNPAATDILIDSFARVYLQLPFAIVAGGKS